MSDDVIEIGASFFAAHGPRGVEDRASTSKRIDKSSIPIPEGRRMNAKNPVGA
jgi:hypothetical protein